MLLEQIDEDFDQSGSEDKVVSEECIRLPGGCIKLPEGCIKVNEGLVHV